MSYEGAVDIYGAPGPRAVMLLHGAVVNRGMWREIGPSLSSAWPVIAPDLPGHGELQHVSFRLSSAADRVAALVDEQGVEHVVLVGESLGGYVALAAAPACEARLVGLVVSGATLNPAGQTGVLLRIQAATVGAIAAVFDEDRVGSWAEAALRRSYPEAPHGAILELGLSVRGRTQALHELAGRDVVADIAEVEAPVLAVNGSRDLPNRLGERSFLRRLGRAELQRVPGVGHGAALARPAVFRRAILGFLERHG